MSAVHINHTLAGVGSPWLACKQVPEDVATENVGIDCIWCSKAHTQWHQAIVDAGGGRFNSTVDLCRMCNNYVPVEYEQPENVMLGLQVAPEGFSYKAGATDVTINPTTLRSRCNPRLLACIFYLCWGNSYLSPHTHHDFCLISIGQ